MLFEYKAKIDEYFGTNWVLTPFFIDGARYEKPPNNQYITLQLIPNERESLTNSNNIIDESGIIKIFCYAESATLAYKLASEVQKFLELQTIEGANIYEGRGDGNGAVHLKDGVYETLLLFKISLIDKIAC